MTTIERKLRSVGISMEEFGDVLEDDDIVYDEYVLIGEEDNEEEE